ncbi:MAG TPA: hypothetical protein VK849_14450 [Longimicrobiales bacterium]|nr:hypothetical protein [Longimicrobiales bacterium]
MMHLDEGRLLALRDGAADLDFDARHHLGHCEACHEAFQAARLRVSAIAGALATLDRAVNHEAARAAVRARVAGHTARTAGTRSVVGAAPRRVTHGLSRAAGLVLLTAAGAAAALPGSPVRRWVGGLLSGEAEVAATAAEQEPASLMAAPEATGLRVDAAAGPLRIVLRNLAPGTELRVQWMPGTEAAVFVPVGSRFATAQGRVEADLVEGGVRVELPRGRGPLTLEVDGRTFLRVTQDGLEVSGPVASRTDAEIVFVRPGP